MTAIKNYIDIGEKYPKNLTPMSTKNLFPIFKEKIKTITLSEFKDFETRIDVKKLLSLIIILIWMIHVISLRSIMVNAPPNIRELALCH